MRDEPRIVVRVADDLLDALRDRLSQVARAAGFQGKIVLLSDDTLQDSAVRLEWADGGAERDPAQTWREIDDILGRVLGPTQKADPEDPDSTAMPAASAQSEPGAGQPAVGLAQSRSLASCRSGTLSSSGPQTLLTRWPRCTAGRAAISSAQRTTFVYDRASRNSSAS